MGRDLVRFLLAWGMALASCGTPAGVVRWRVELAERIDATPVVQGERAIVVTRKGTLASIATATGAVERRRQLQAGVWATPALVGEILILAREDGTVEAVDARTFELRWTWAAPARAFSGVSAAGDRVWLASGATLVALQAADGVELARVALPAPSFTAPAVGQGVVVVGTRDGSVVAVDAASGRIRWRATTTAGVAVDGPPALAGDRVLIGGNDRALHAFALADGRALWRARGGNWVVSRPAIAGEVAIYGDDDGVVRAVAIEDGRLVWRARAGGDVASSPLLVGDLVVHGAHDGKVYAEQVDDGANVFTVPAGAAIFAAPALVPGAGVVAATHAGVVLLIQSGRE